MNCAESQVLIQALIDGELDAGHMSDVEAHVATCPACAGELKALRAMREAIAAASKPRSRHRRGQAAPLRRRRRGSHPGGIFSAV